MPILKYPEDILNKIINKNCIEVVKEIPDDVIDIVITSPPYNVDLGNTKNSKDKYDEYEDKKPIAEYLSWLKSIFFDIQRVVKIGGKICINIGDSKNGAIPMHSHIIQFMIELDYIPFSTIIWNKSQTNPRTAWGSFHSPKCPSFPTPFEYILIFAKGEKSLQEQGETDLLKQEFIDWTLALWNIKPETKKFGHPAVFPVEIPTRLMKMLSWKNSVVFDPFCGSGTTALAAKMNGRNYISCDISEQYCKIAEQRLKSLISQDDLF